MANSLNISNNIFDIIIVVIALVAIIVIVIQWRRVRNSKSQVKYLEKQAEHKEIELVEKDLEPKHIMIGLPETLQEQLSPIRNNTGKMLRKVGFLQTKLNERITRMEPSKDYKELQKLLEGITRAEPSKEYKKLQKVLKEMEMKEKKIEKKSEK